MSVRRVKDALSRERVAIHGRHIGHERSAERKVERAVGKAIRAENRRRDVKSRGEHANGPTGGVTPRRHEE